MSLRSGIATTYASQLITAALGIVLVPVYLRYLGAEAYGLVGFYAALLAWFLFLDVGLSGTLSRETARFRGAATTGAELRTLFDAELKIFAVVGLVGGALIVFGSAAIGDRWLQVTPLLQADATTAIALMGLVIPCRWVSVLFRAVVMGAERYVWLAGFTTVVAFLRFVAVIPILIFSHSPLLGFFAFQILVGLVEAAVLALAAYKILPRRTVPPIDVWYAPLRRTASFSGALCLATIAWLVVTQADRFLLSIHLSLHDYGYFTVAVTLASAVTLLTVPVGQALQPRMTRLFAEDEAANAVRLYGLATQWVSFIATSLGATIACFAEQALHAWTGDRTLAREMAPVLALYAAGNSVLAVSAMPYHLRYSMGNLSLHTIATSILALILLPTMWWAVGLAGALGAATVWLGSMVIFLVLWTPFAHAALTPGITWKWLSRDVGLVAFPGIAVAGVAYMFLPAASSRNGELCELIFVAAGVGVASGFASGAVRDFAGHYLGRIRSTLPMGLR